MRFEFATAGRIVFGEGSLREVAPAAKQMGERALLVTGRHADRAQPLVESLAAAGVATTAFPVAGEPTLELVRRGAERARAADAATVIAIGGGSAIDAGKAIAALAANGGDVLDYIEVIGEGRPLRVPSLPCIAVPTTAGTGAEVTRNAVLASPERQVKASLRGPFVLPRLAVVDPELTYSLPPAVTASTGLDALTQIIEPYVSLRANAATDMFCLEGMRRAAGALVQAYREGRDPDARRDMAFASLLGGLALANAGLGAVHGLAAPIGGMFPAPHGAVCAALLPGVMEMNLRALRARAPESEALARYETVACTLTGKADARADDGVAWVRKVCRELGIAPLAAYGVRSEHVPALVQMGARASSMKGNPIALTPDELAELLNPGQYPHSPL
jgi:alcohol dehydrogenase class IV